ncbi:MAG: phosphocholine cytidylyltransferase family protein [Burkholderiales bacterium]|nr:phosphocholine cytidylyltransferase family protein [Burkholderiales bacterium]
MARAVILAAGQGTRLRPLTDHLPKALVSLDGVPLIERQLAVLRRAGVTDLSVVAGYRASHLRLDGLRQVENPAYESTNMVASLYCAKALFDGTDDVLVCYGDIVYEPRVLSALMATDAPLAVTIDRQWLTLWSLRMDDPLSDVETLRLDDYGRILELGRKPRDLADIQGQYIGLFKVRKDFAPEFFDAYERLGAEGTVDGRSRAMMYMTSYLQLQIDAGVQVLAAAVDGGWLEVDSLQDLQRYEAASAEGRLSSIYDARA